MNLNDELIFQFRKELDEIKNLECKNCHNSSLSFNQRKYCLNHINHKLHCRRGITWKGPIRPYRGIDDDF